MANAATYGFRIGSLACTALLDGIEEITPAQIVFENAPPDELAAALSCQGTSAASGFLATWTCLLITTEQHKVLVDTGMGRIEPTSGHLMEALREAGAEPRDINLVILSHGHGDHIAGNTQADGSLTFPNAEWVIDREEWKFWLQSPHPPSVPEFFGEIAWEQLQPIADHVTLVDRAKEIVPGVSLVPLHVEHPEWCAATWADMDWEQVALSRRHICDRAAAEDALVLSYHFYPFPSLGHIRRPGRAWQWEPIAT